MPDALTTLFAEILEIDEKDINDDISPKNTSQWDSLTSMHLIAAIETTFDIYLSTKEIAKMDSIGMVRQVLKEKNVTL
jgi:acyl carrier protein